MAFAAPPIHVHPQRRAVSGPALGHPLDLAQPTTGQRGPLRGARDGVGPGGLPCPSTRLGGVADLEADAVHPGRLTAGDHRGTDDVPGHRDVAQRDLQPEPGHDARRARRGAVGPGARLRGPHREVVDAGVPQDRPHPVEAQPRLGQRALGVHGSRLGTEVRDRGVRHGLGLTGTGDRHAAARSATTDVLVATVHGVRPGRRRATSPSRRRTPRGWRGRSAARSTGR